MIQYISGEDYKGKTILFVVSQKDVIFTKHKNETVFVRLLDLEINVCVDLSMKYIKLLIGKLLTFQ